MNKQLTVRIDETEYQIDYSKSPWSGKEQLLVNGKAMALQKSPLQALIGIDQSVTIGGRVCRIVVIGNKADIAVDGVYVGSGKPYIPLKSMPWWNWIFIVACAAIPIVSLGGAFPLALALLGVIYCLRVSISPDMHTYVKVLSCLGISALAWALFGMLLWAMAYLRG